MEVYHNNIKTQGTLRFLFVALCLFVFLTSFAQKTVTRTNYIGFGYNSMQDTYLSPEHYGGMELRYISHQLRENGKSPFTGKQGNGDWTRLIISEGHLSKGKSRSENGATLGGAYHFEYGILHRKRFLGDKLTTYGGAAAEFLGGFLYNTRNGNNPAQMRAMLNIGLAGRADYAVGRNSHVVYEASLPLLGLAFSPNYGQSYYEIFSEGNYDRNIVPTTAICSPSLRHTLTYCFPLKSLNLSVGYLGDYRQQGVNNLKQHVYTHNIIIGIAKKLGQ